MKQSSIAILSRMGSLLKFVSPMGDAIESKVWGCELVYPPEAVAYITQTLISQGATRVDREMSLCTH